MTARFGKFRPCPTCGYRTKAHTHVSGPSEQRVVPKAGDASVCLRCGQLLLYVLDMVGLRFRLPTQDELEQLLDEDGVADVLAAWTATFHRTPEMRHS